MFQSASVTLSQVNGVLVTVSLGTLIAAGLLIIRVVWKVRGYFAKGEVIMIDKNEKFEKACETIQQMESNHLTHIEQHTADAAESLNELKEQSREDSRELRSLLAQLLAKK